jgi:hypothetical protein
MTLLVIVGVLFGIILGQFFTCYVLIPACGLALVFGLADPAHMNSNLLDSFLHFVVLTTTMQIGYVVGLVVGNFHPEPMRSKQLKDSHFDEILSRHAEASARDKKAA